MKAIVHPSNSRGSADYGWLKTNYSFSFADYNNPERMGFGALRVLNDDTIAGAGGFDAHSHDNMEIVTIVLEGSLKHSDSMGNSGVIPAGDVQKMSAGTGVVHSEKNASQKEPVKLLQAWVYPRESGLDPSYGQKSFRDVQKKNTLVTLVSGFGEADALQMNSDARFLLGKLGKGAKVSHQMHSEGQGAYVFVISGKIRVAGKELEKRDAAGIYETKKIEIEALSDSQVLVIEVALG
ncbi:MAG: pirin family protein [archaeon]|nr:pirin family protein [archaeon]